ncbi:pentapeptide repeat-containing protein [Okeania sp.]|uniref:pentapeptide repeat-containing protein n=1 Tax=Okeania sp. TaxID=3100323 RepID=UPI002B4B4C15|nr:pentapeptide repeat-containing protein [Okeania sp.]MEB3342469.1 pentapeptide repeat-containing protein [Okeania sp.]
MKRELSNYGYEIIREMEPHQQQGEVTYQGLALKQDQEVFIKEFSFADGEANWAGFEAYEREVEILKQLQHPRIPNYIDALETPEGFCLITEYKEGKSLAEKRNFTPEQIKQITISILEILVYLQKNKPPIIHGNIKPENILVNTYSHTDKFPTAYLINFGCARIGIEENLSDGFSGTSGFMPPEQELNGSVTINSDLYSLGVTIICLLTGTPSTNVRKLFDRNHRLNLKKIMPQLSTLFTMWLEKMISPNSKDRFASAAAALAALKPIPVFSDAPNFKNVAMAMQPVKASAIVGVASIAALALLATSLTIVRQQRYQTNFQRTPRFHPEKTIQRTSSKNSIAKLQETSECQGCHLRGANLAGIKLEDAYLRDANLFRANLRGAELKGARLQNANLAHAELPGANLSNAKLQEANLNNAKLQGTNLTNSNLANAQLQKASLSGASLFRAVLESANLQEANLSGANLSQANLVGTNFYNANFRDAKLTGAKLKGADLRKANLSAANMNNVSLRGADLREAILKDASLRRVDLVGANLAGARLLHVDLEKANLQGANLQGANLLGAKLTKANLEGANLEGAIMPDGSLNE